MAQYIKDEKIENIIKEIIIPDLEKLLSKEYQADAEIIYITFFRIFIFIYM